MAVPGTSLQLNKDYDLALHSQVGGLPTLVMVSGREELEQSLRIRLLTRLGEDILSPDCGLPVGAMIRVSTDEFTVGSIQRCLLREPRVKDIAISSVATDKFLRKSTVAANMTAIDGTAFVFNAPVPV